MASFTNLQQLQVFRHDDSTIQNTHVSNDLVIVPSVPLQPQKASKVITIQAIIQILIGIIITALGIASLFGYSRSIVAMIGGGIWVGVWVTSTGIVGSCSSVKPANRELYGVYIGFCIMTIIMTLIVGIILAYELQNYARYARYYEGTLIIHVVLMLLIIIQLCIALFASIYCCIVTACCCQRANGFVMQHQPYGFINVAAESNAMMSVATNAQYSNLV